jgi:acyl-CoA synthetase (AMP-forming)/AMP-acid ligase II
VSFETILDDELIEANAGLWVNRTITDHLDEVVAATPDKTAFTDSRRSITYAALKAEVDRCALGFLDLGVRAGDVVSFQLPNWIEWVVVHFAASRIGAISNPLIPIYREREVGFMVGLARSNVLVVPRTFRCFDHAAMAERLRPQWSDLEHVLAVGSTWDEFAAAPREEREFPRPDPDDVTLLIFTSGTTGEPKGVMHTHNTAIAANNPLPARLGITADSVIHMASTLAHLTGFSTAHGFPCRTAPRACCRMCGIRRGSWSWSPSTASPTPPPRPRSCMTCWPRPAWTITTCRRSNGSAAWARPLPVRSYGKPGRSFPIRPYWAAGARARTRSSPSASPATRTTS